MKNLILIGMPSAGKSTVGVIVAKILGMNFTDTDVLLQTQTGRLLQDIINEDGIKAFLEQEEKCLLSLQSQNTVIATGGSAVYSQKAMQYLKTLGKIIYLHIDNETVRKRLNNLRTRGVVLTPGQTLEDIYQERLPLYKKYADIFIDCSRFAIDDTVDAIVLKVKMTYN